MNLPAFLTCLASASILMLTSCSQTAPTPATQYLSGVGVEVPAGGASQGFWDGEGTAGSPKIRINLAEQRAYFYKDTTLVGVTPISSGDSAHRTPTGTFKVTQRSPDHRSSLYGQHVDIATGAVLNPDVDTRKDRLPRGAKYVGAPMTHFLRFNGGIGMHKGHLPGYPASHGCVRLPGHMAKHFYEHAPLGTPVIVE